ncbi:hypothetical protein V6N13_013652 [Hibiscus sabdariffa]
MRVIEGLKFVWESKIRYIVLEVDNLDVVQLLSHHRVNSGHDVLFCTAVELLDHDWKFRICHISRTTNRVTNDLVKLFRSENACPLDEVSSNSLVFGQPPYEVLALFQDDLRSLRDVV